MLQHESVSPNAPPIDATWQTLTARKGRALKEKIPLAVFVSRQGGESGELIDTTSPRVADKG